MSVAEGLLISKNSSVASVLSVAVVAEKKNYDVGHVVYFSLGSSPTCDIVAFKVYDVDRDGYISNGELFLVLKMMVGNNLKACCTGTDISIKNS
jgi:hypothetical protein